MNTAPAFFDDLQLAGGAVKIDRSAAEPVRVRRLKAAGENSIIVAGSDDLPSRKTILAFDDADIAAGASWTVRGARTTMSRVVVDLEAKCLVLRTEKGFRVTFR